MDIKDRFGTNRQKELEGTWADAGDGLRLKLGRLGNRKYQDEYTRLLRPHRQLLRTGRLPDELADKIICETMSKTVLLGWEGLTEGGEPVEYSPAKAQEILLAYPDFRDLVTAMASDMERFKDEMDTDAIKNSERSLSGT